MLKCWKEDFTFELRERRSKTCLSLSPDPSKPVRMISWRRMPPTPSIPPSSASTQLCLVSQKLFPLFRQIWKNKNFRLTCLVTIPLSCHSDVVFLSEICECRFTGSSAARLSHESQVAVGAGGCRGRRSTWEELKQPERLKSREREEVMNPRRSLCGEARLQ